MEPTSTQLNCGKYRGHELADIPTEYLQWASVHLPLDTKSWDSVMAEYSRRLNKSIVAGESSAQLVWEKVEHPINKLIAKVMMRLRGY